MDIPRIEDYYTMSEDGSEVEFNLSECFVDAVDYLVNTRVEKELKARAAKAKRDTSSRTFIIQVTTKDQSYMSYIENDIKDALRNCKVKLETIGISELGVRTIEHPWSVREKKAAGDSMDELYGKTRKDKN